MFWLGLSCLNSWVTLNWFFLYIWMIMKTYAKTIVKAKSTTCSVCGCTMQGTYAVTKQGEPICDGCNTVSAAHDILEKGPS